MLFFWVLKGYIVCGSRRTYQAVKEILSCFLPIGPLPVSPGRPVSFWQQLLAACGGRGWAGQLQTSVGPEPGPPGSLSFSHTHALEPTVCPAQRATFILRIQSVVAKKVSEDPKISLVSSSFHSFFFSFSNVLNLPKTPKVKNIPFICTKFVKQSQFSV